MHLLLFTAAELVIAAAAITFLSVASAVKHHLH
jgi:hypothetical protein